MQPGFIVYKRFLLAVSKWDNGEEEKIVLAQTICLLAGIFWHTQSIFRSFSFSSSYMILKKKQFACTLIGLFNIWSMWSNRPNKQGRVFFWHFFKGCHKHRDTYNLSPCDLPSQPGGPRPLRRCSCGWGAGSTCPPSRTHPYLTPPAQTPPSSYSRRENMKIRNFGKANPRLKNKERKD